MSAMDTLLFICLPGFMAGVLALGAIFVGSYLARRD